MAWADDRDGSAGYVTVTTLASVIDEAVPFVVVYLSDLPADFHTAMSDASDTDGKTIRVSTSDGTTQLACVPIGVNTGTDTGCLIFLGTGMSASSDVDYRIYVGNASLSMPTASGGMGEQAVFAAYESVYFPGVDTRDWTAGGRTLTAVDTPTTAASNFEGITASVYNGSSEYHKYEGTLGVTDWPMTLETSVYPTTTSSTRYIVGIYEYSRATPPFTIYRSGTPSINCVAQGSGGSAATAVSASISANTWYNAIGTRDSTNAPGDTYLYLDGTQTTSATNTTAAGTLDRFVIGCGALSSAYGSFFTGRVAFAFLSDSVRSADYATTMQDNWAGALYSVGTWTATATCNSGSTGWVLFQTAATTSASGTLVDWTNTANALDDDADYATGALDNGGNYETEYLNLTNPAYGTTIPTGADSYTISFLIKRARDTGGGHRIDDLTVQFIDDTGTRVGDNLAVAGDWPTTAATQDYTVTGLTPDGTEFTSAAGLAIRATAVNAAGLSEAYILTAWIKVDWTCGDAASKARGFFALTE